MPGRPIEADDVRRAARYCVSIYESDLDAMRRVAREVHLAGRWPETALACGLINRVLLTKVDEAADDEGAIALWLFTAAEQILGDGDAWWTEGGDDD